MINNSLNMGKLEILIKVFKLLDIVDIIASWEKLTVVFSKCYYVSNISTEPKFSSYRFILMKMIHHLPIKEIDIINIFLFT